MNISKVAGIAWVYICLEQFEATLVLSNDYVLHLREKLKSEIMRKKSNTS